MAVSVLVFPFKIFFGSPLAGPVLFRHHRENVLPFSTEGKVRLGTTHQKGNDKQFFAQCHVTAMETSNRLNAHFFHPALFYSLGSEERPTLIQLNFAQGGCSWVLDKPKNQ